MLTFTHPSNSYDVADRESRTEHDLIMLGYASCVVGSPQARMKGIIGDLLCPTKGGDDAYVSYGRGLSVILHAALPGDGLESVPFLGNSPKDTALQLSEPRKQPGNRPPPRIRAYVARKQARKLSFQLPGLGKSPEMEARTKLGNGSSERARTRGSETITSNCFRAWHSIFVAGGDKRSADSRARSRQSVRMCATL